MLNKYNFKVNKFSIILVVIWMSTFTYFIQRMFFNGVFSFAKATNIIYAFIIFLIALVALLRKQKILKYLPLNLYLFLVIWLFIIGIVSNSMVEVMPSFLRFSLYYLVAILTYTYIQNKGLTTFNAKMRVFTLCLFFVAIFFGFYEVFFLKIRFMNGAYRFSGSFLGHPLANSMFLVMLLLLWFEYFLSCRRTLINIIGFLALFYLFFNTHSRMPLAFLFFSFFMYYFLKEKRLLKFLKSFALILLAFVGLFVLVTRTEISPRLKKLVLSDKAFEDPSTNTRFTIIENSLGGMTPIEKVVGIGLGGFNNFYNEISGKDGVAAHNNFLLFFVEGGIVGLLMFLLYQFILFKTLFSFIRKPPIRGQIVNYQRLIFVSVFLLEICSFLLNNYYFFTSQTIIFIILGLMMYLELKPKESNVL